MMIYVFKTQVGQWAALRSEWRVDSDAGRCARRRSGRKQRSASPLASEKWEISEIGVDSKNRGEHVAPSFVAGWSSLVARQAHNLKVVGSNPTPAPNFKPSHLLGRAFL